MFLNVYKHFEVNSIPTIRVFMKIRTDNIILKFQDFITNIIVSENLGLQLFVIIFSDFFFLNSTLLAHKWSDSELKTKYKLKFFKKLVHLKVKASGLGKTPNVWILVCDIIVFSITIDLAHLLWEKYSLLLHKYKLIRTN